MKEIETTPKKEFFKEFKSLTLKEQDNEIAKKRATSTIRKVKLDISVGNESFANQPLCKTEEKLLGRYNIIIINV
jgi:hypothetical protein